MEIKYVETGIANCFEDGSRKWIEINKGLKEYPSLHNKILAHEKAHFRSKKKIDFKEEIKNLFSWNADLFKFVFKYPASLTQISPIMFRNRKIAFDWFMILGYSLIGGILYAIA